MPLPLYIKPPKTHREQLQLLKDRGLRIESDSKALHLLGKLNYFRLSGYWYPLLAEPKNAHRFKEGASFQTAFQLYRFDRDLRIFILKELEKIEVAFRARLIHTYCHARGVFWISDVNLFSNAASHGQTINKVSQAYKKSDEDFITSFRRNYSNPLPPAWMISEIASFGCLSTLYKNLRPGKSKREIAHEFGLDDTTLSSWLHCLVYIRNVCAHHSRLWNRGMSIRPRIPSSPTNQWLLDTSVSNNKSYFILSMMLYLLQFIDSRHQFVYRLKVLLKKYPTIDVSAMGFPKGWMKEPLWTFRPTLKQWIRLLMVFKVK